jgi:predicted DNA-binding transcriptional regulator AlpA
MRFLRPRDVLALIGVSRTTLWRMVRAGRFPAPVRITERSAGFLQETVESWMRSRVAGVAWKGGETNLVEVVPTVGRQFGFAKPARRIGA